MVGTVRELVEVLGGTSAVARWLGIQPSAVSMWIERDHIPPGWHLRLFLECTSRGLVVDLALFGLKGDEAGLQMPPRRGGEKRPSAV